MNTATVKRIINNNKNRMAVILDNGINRHFDTGKPWNDVLLDLWEKFSFDTLGDIPAGISLTEVYDILELQNYERNNITYEIQKKVVSIYNSIDPNREQNNMLNAIKEMNMPIMTTNFDDLMPRGMDLRFFKNMSKKFTDYYPWDCYYSDRELSLPTEGFAIWYINGMLHYFRSIKLGLSQYMGNVDRARKMIHGNSENIEFNEKNQNNWPGLHTWMHIIFNKSLFIIGLDLQENEVFLRWLLIERAKYFRKFPMRKQSSWFLEIDNVKNEGRNFFLEKLGFQVITLKSYREIYEDIWS